MCIHTCLSSFFFRADSGIDCTCAYNCARATCVSVSESEDDFLSTKVNTVLTAVDDVDFCKITHVINQKRFSFLRL